MIARLENLGSTATLPVRITSFTARGVGNRDVAVTFTAEDINNHSHFILERSVNGVDFEEIYRNTETLANGAKQSFNYLDQQKTNAKTLYYRIRQCDVNGACTYSEIKPVTFAGINKNIRLYPSPASSIVKLSYTAETGSSINISFIDAAGSAVLKDTHKVMAGENTLQLNIQQLKPGTYSVIIHDGEEKSFEKLIKL